MIIKHGIKQLRKSSLKNTIIESAPEIECAHRTGRPRRHDGTPKLRTVVCMFTSYKAKEAILKKARRIKPEGLKVFEDLAKGTMEKRSMQLPQLKQAEAQNKLVISFLINSLSETDQLVQLMA